MNVAKIDDCSVRVRRRSGDGLSGYGHGWLEKLIRECDGKSIVHKGLDDNPGKGNWGGVRRQAFRCVLSNLFRNAPLSICCRVLIPEIDSTSAASFSALSLATMAFRDRRLESGGETKH